jgi:hypothetical protein
MGYLFSVFRLKLPSEILATTKNCPYDIYKKAKVLVLLSLCNSALNSV